MIAEEALHALSDELRNAQPYPGLCPFKREESRYFKGRDAQVEEIIQRLASDSCIVVLGGSGCGKSSVVRAGVIPALRLKMLPGRGDFWRVAICSPGRAPVTNLVEALDGLLTSDDSGKRRKQIRDVLYGSNGLGGFLPTFKKDIPLHPGLSEKILDKANLLVLIDQFEELFREENRGTAEAAALAGFIVDAWRRRDRYPGLYLVLTMRTDDLHRCAEFLDLPDVINASGYLTRRLKETELRQAIVEPPRSAMFRAGLIKGERPSGTVDLRPYEVQVVTELLDAVQEIAHDPDHLPLLQHLLAVLWRTAHERWQWEATARPEVAEPQITLQDLARALGCENWNEALKKRSAAYHVGVSGWLLRHCLEYVAEQLYADSIYDNRLTERQQEIARVAFCLMGEVDDRGNFKRRWTNREEIARVAGLEEPDANVEAVIRRFHKDHRLLWVRASGEIDVSHESLMRNWPRLGKQLEEDRDAGAACQYLVQRYKGWQQARQHRYWPSWLTKWFGLLPAHELERVERLLAPRYNRSWSERFIPDGNQQWDTEATGAHPSEGLLRNGSLFLACRAYVQRSMRRNSAARGLKFLGIPIGLLIVVSLIFVIILSYQREALKALQKSKAAIIWSGLSGYSPVLSAQKVQILWELTTAQTEFRSVFVDQFEMLANLREFGYRPHPVIRAVGLGWSQDLQKVGLTTFLKGFNKEANKSKEDWDFAALACAVEALDNRMAASSRKQALQWLSDYVQFERNEQLSSRQLWPYSRVFACVGDQLPDEAGTIALGTMKQAVARIAALPLDKRPMDSLGTLGFAYTTAVIASQPSEQASLEAADNELKQAIEKAIDSTIIGLGTTQGFMALLTAQPLAPLITKLPPHAQKEALGQLLSFVATQTGPNEDLLLVLVQTFELLAENAKKNPEQNVFPNEIELERWLREQWVWWTLAQPQDVTVTNLATARLIAPLAEAVGRQTDVVNKLLPIAGVEASATDHLTAVTKAIQKLPDEEDEGSLNIVANDMRLGPQARLLATFVALGQADQTASDSAANVIIKALGPTSMQPSGSFAREGLARALAALAPQLQGQPREKALETAHQQLARTGSAAEAAAWSRAIVKLLESEKDAYRFVEQIIEVLKYPNTALIDREPGVSEPRSATDILVEALRSRLHLTLPEGKQPWNGGLQQVLDLIKEKDKRFKTISLSELPECPEPSGVCPETNE